MILKVERLIPLHSPYFPCPPLANLTEPGILSLLLFCHIILQQFCLHHSWPQRHIADSMAPQLVGTVSSQSVALWRHRMQNESQDTWPYHLRPLPSLLPVGMPQGLPFPGSLGSLLPSFPFDTYSGRTRVAQERNCPWTGPRERCGPASLPNLSTGDWTSRAISTTSMLYFLTPT